MNTSRNFLTVFVLFCTTLANAHDFEVDGIYYDILDKEEQTVAVTYQGYSYDSYNEYIGDITIPSSVTYNGTTYSVTKIGLYAFKSCIGLTSISVPDNVESICYSAFMNCNSLIEVTLGKGLKTIDSQAFWGCTKLLNCNIPHSVTNIGESAFRECSNLKNINIPDSIINIDCSSFRGCENIETIKIPKGVAVIKEYAFYGCKRLTSVEISEGVIEIEEGAFSNCGMLEKIIIPNTIEKIGIHAFSYCYGIREIVLGNNVTNIGSYAFYNCNNLQCVTLGNSIFSIEGGAFGKCEKLKIIINNSSLKITKGSSFFGGVAYYANAIISQENSHEYTRFQDFYFHKTDTTQVLVAYIGSDSILQLPTTPEESHYNICDSVFYKNSNLKNITIPNCITSIGVDAFSGCNNLGAVYINDLNSWCKIDFNSETSNPLYYAENLYHDDILLTKIVIPNGVFRIKQYAFINCSNIGCIEIPQSINSIENKAFYGCHKDTIINFSHLVIENSSSNGYLGYYAKKIINAPSGEKVENKFIFCDINDEHCLVGYIGDDTNLILPEKYKYAINNDVFKNCTNIKYVEVPNSITKIGENAFYGCSNLKTIVNFSHLIIKNNSSYGHIGYYANKIINAPDGEKIDNKFYFCSINNKHYLAGYIGDDTNLILPNNYKDDNYIIGEQAFYYCDRLVSLIIPNSVTCIEKDAFRNCANLNQIEIPNSVKTIGECAFYNCKEMSNVIFGNGIINIGKDSFFGCSNLKKVSISDIGNWCNIEFNSIYSNPLYYTDNLYFNNELLTQLFVPEEVTHIKKYAFNYCGKIINIILPNNLISIEDNAFYKCGGFTQIRFPDSLTVIGSNAFAGCTSLNKVEFGYGVTKIGNSAFGNCSELKEIHIKDIAAWCGIDFNSYSSNPLSYTHSLYLNDKQVTSLVIPDEVTDIKKFAFYGCSTFTSIEISNSVTSIGEEAFYGCSGLVDIIIPDGVRTIEASAFEGCSNVTTLYISKSIEGIGHYAFDDCNNISNIKIGATKAITCNTNIFEEDVYNNAILYVPTDRKFAYEKTNPWNLFYIKEMDFTGINDINSNRDINTYYDLNGNIVEIPSSGVYIVNGKKILVR